MAEKQTSQRLRRKRCRSFHCCFSFVVTLVLYVPCFWQIATANSENKNNRWGAYDDRRPPAPQRPYPQHGAEDENFRGWLSGDENDQDWGAQSMPPSANSLGPQRSDVPPLNPQQEQQPTRGPVGPRGPRGPGGSVGPARTPIHYEFPSAESSMEKRKQKSRVNDVDEVPQTFLDRMDGSDEARFQSQATLNYDNTRSFPQYASPRRDAVTRYTSTLRGRVALMLSSSLVGASMGAFVGKSILNQPRSFAMAFSSLFFFVSVLRNPYGELARALGMALILALQRTRSIRRRYPTWPHIKACIRAAPRRTFPPADNPWSYRPENPSRDVPFRMVYSVIAMGFVGSACGGNLPLVPTWIGGISGAGLFAFGTTVKSPRGDLARTMGMRVVSLCEEFLSINSELQIIRKLGVVSERVVDKLFILDRKHRIKDRLVAAFSWCYERVSGTVSQVRSEIQEESQPPPNRDKP